MPKYLVAAVAVLALIPADRVVIASEVDGKSLVRAFVDDVSTMSARFEQTLVDADDNVIEESSGHLKIKRPGRFRWTYESPYEQLLVADGNNVWSYDADLAQVTVKPQAEILGSTPALLLGGGKDALSGFEMVNSFEDRETMWVRLVPTTPDSGFDSVDLGFNNRQLTRMIFVDALGQSTLIALFDIVINAPLSDELFSFELPPDADLVGTPVVAGDRDP